MKNGLNRLLAILISAAILFSMTGINTVFAIEPQENRGEITAFAPLEESITSQTVPLGTAWEDLSLPETVTATVFLAVYAKPATVSETFALPVTWEDGGYDCETPADYKVTAQPTGGYTLAEGVALPVITVTVEVPQVSTMLLSAASVEEQFNLPVGETYYFDLSGQSIPGTVNTALPDTTLHYVPFTYTGTVNAYSLKSRSTDEDTALTDSETAAGTTNTSNAIGYTSNHSLFIADYNLSHTVSWDGLNAASLIFGKDFTSGDVSYQLRVPSVGSTIPLDGSQDVTPYTNEWDTILNKDSTNIQNWSGIGSLGQDTISIGEAMRAIRGNESANYFYFYYFSESRSGYGFRPVLKIINDGSLNTGSLCGITLYLNGGSLGSISDKIKIAVKEGTTYTAPGNAGLTLPSGIGGEYFKWNTQADGKGDDYEAGANVPMSVTTLYAKWVPTEQFTLSTGTTYYFDLSVESIPGSVNAGQTDPYTIPGAHPSLPDTTLHFVPFTYTGTVNGYSLGSAQATTEEWASSNKSDRSLFVADYNVSHTVSWDQLNAANLIFGRNYIRNGVSYKLRVPSMGSSDNGYSNDKWRGIPLCNEWDAMLNKSNTYIQNWINIGSWGQDTYSSDASIRTLRGSSSIRTKLNFGSSSSYPFLAFRPVLEILGADLLDADSLQPVTLNLNGGSLGGSSDTISIVVKKDTSCTVPGSEGLTRPSGSSGDYFRWNTQADGKGTSYEAGASILYEVNTLYAQWEYPPEETPNIAIDYETEQLTGFVPGASYEIDSSSVAPTDGKLDITGYIGKIISIVKKGNGTTTRDSEAKSLGVPSRPTLTATDFTVTQPSTIGGEGSIEGITAVMEYSTDGGTNWMIGGSTTSNITGGTTYLIRMKATSSTFMSTNYTITINAFNPTQEATPNIAIDYETEELLGFISGAGYEINGIPVTSTDGKLDITSYIGKTISIVKKGNGTTTSDSEAQSLSIPARPEAPTAVGVNESYPNANDGKITGMNTAVEYQKSGDTGWITATGTEVTGLSAGTYYIRIKAISSAFKSDYQTINIGTTAKTLLGIDITTPPTNIVYTEGQSFDALEMVITATYSDHSTAVVTGYTVSPSGALTTADATITISYIEGGVTKTVDQEITVNAAVTYHTVTFNPNGGTAVGSQMVIYGEKISKPTDPARSGYSFVGWYSDSALTVPFNFDTAITGNTTLYGKWSFNSGSSGDGNGSRGGSSSGNTGSGSMNTVTPSKPTEANPNPPTTSTINTPATVDNNGNTTVSVTDKAVADAIKAAQEAAKKTGTEKNGISVMVNVTMPTTSAGSTASSLSATLPEKAVDALIAAGVTEVKIQSGISTITLDLAALKHAQTVARGDIIIKVEKTDISKMSAAAQTAIGNRPVFNLSMTSGGKAVTDFNGGSVSVVIPYTLQEGEKAGNIQAVYIDGNGNVNYITNSNYDVNAKLLRFSTNHFSVYGVAYKAAALAFNDIANHWAKDDIEFVAARGLLSGTGNNQFSPDSSMTRGMFVTALGRLSGADVSSYKQSSFIDVKADAYYMPHVEWASKNGIVKGIGNNLFAADTAITREEMAVIMVNYAKTMKYTLPANHAEVKFADADSISPWAKDTVKAMQMAGILMGKDADCFDPKGMVTRDEVSAMIHRYVEQVIDIQI